MGERGVRKGRKGRRKEGEKGGRRGERGGEGRGDGGGEKKGGRLQAGGAGQRGRGGGGEGGRRGVRRSLRTKLLRDSASIFRRLPVRCFEKSRKIASKIVKRFDCFSNGQNLRRSAPRLCHGMTML